MKWYVYYKENGYPACKCFDQDENKAHSFADSVNGSAYMGF